MYRVHVSTIKYHTIRFVSFGFCACKLGGRLCGVLPMVLPAIVGAPVARGIPKNQCFLAVPIDADPLGPSDRHPDGTQMVARASSLRVQPYRSARVAPTRSAAIGTAVQRPAGARRKRLAQNHHSGGQPLRAAGHWRDHGGQPDHRDGLCRPCRPSTTRRGQAPCFANHQPRVLLCPENLPPAGLCRTSAPCRMALI